MIQLLKDAAITLTVLPATEIFLNGRNFNVFIPRGMVNANEPYNNSLNTTISSNNILNALIPYADASLIRIANMFTNITKLSTDKDLQKCM